MAKAKAPAVQVKEYANDIIREIEHWKKINEHGCNDPYWTDGVNMNLTRNHVISDKRRIMEICTENNIRAPDELYLPTPPEADKGYMAKDANPVRLERLQKYGKKITHEKAKYNENQMSIF